MISPSSAKPILIDLSRFSAPFVVWHESEKTTGNDIHERIRAEIEYEAGSTSGELRSRVEAGLHGEPREHTTTVEDMLCGGSATMILDVLDPGDTEIDVPRRFTFEHEVSTPLPDYQEVEVTVVAAFVFAGKLCVAVEWGGAE